jgi:competence protein ComEA
MSFYRTVLAAVAAVVIASPVFADDTATTQPSTDTTPAAQTTDGAAMQPTASADQQATSAEQTKVNLNKATAKELMKVKGLNAAKARAIVAYRKKHPFTSTEELSKVKGFKKVNSDSMKEIQDQLSVE